MAPTDEVGQLKPVKCTYINCCKRFDTEKEMKRHKKAETEHFYCKKCDVDCEDWNHLQAHKVAAMAPWVEGRMAGNKDESPKHIVCEFCGMDFMSFKGRKIHREQLHPADQRIMCLECDTIFTRAGNYIAHFEQNKCSGISRRQFLGYVQHKHIRKEIMQNPGQMTQKLLDNQTSFENPALIEGGVQDVEEGGVNLLDEDDQDQRQGIPPLQAERKLIEMNARPQLRGDSLEKWPRLPGHIPNPPTESMRKLSVASSAAEKSASEFASEITSRRGGIKVFTESSLSPKSPNTSTFLNEEDDTASIASTAVASAVDGLHAWTTRSTSQVLFKDARPTPPPVDWSKKLQTREEEAQAHPTLDLRHSRFWDPSSEHFDINLFKFWNGVTERFHCPFEGCEDAVYDIGVDLVGHLHHAHIKTRFRCPLCLKVFNSPGALISHSESTGKCKVRKSNKYGELLNEVSGGLLKAEYVAAPKIAKEKDGGLQNGIMTTRFTAQKPEQR